MTTHIMSMTYVPKIHAVFSGAIKQTIRMKRSMVVKKPGDELLIHTWQGRPYRSQWQHRLSAKIQEVNVVKIDSGLWWRYDPRIGSYVLMADHAIDMIAKMDGIVPPSKAELESVLAKLNNLNSLDETTWEIISWAVPQLEGE